MRTGFCLTGVILALLLAGCAPRGEVAAENTGCRVRRDTEMAMQRDRQFMLLPATLESQPVRMVLDTGAEVSTISPAIARDFGLREDQANGRVLRGVGGDVRTGSVMARRFAIGTLRPGPARFSLGPSNILPGLSPPVAGLLGADLLDGRDIDLDAPGGRAALYTIKSCPNFHPWPGVSGTPMSRTPTGLDFVVADFDGNAVRALLDTGARGSFMTRRLAASLGITDEMLLADPISVKIGISRSEIDVRLHRFDQVTLGPVTWRDVPIGVADIPLPGIDMLLGADLLGRQRVWISPARGMLWLR
jgi:predicted aspartyl protease